MLELYHLLQLLYCGLQLLKIFRQVRPPSPAASGYRNVRYDAPWHRLVFSVFYACHAEICERISPAHDSLFCISMHAESLVCCAVLPSPSSQPALGQDSMVQPRSPTSRSRKPTNELDDLTLRFEALKKR